MTGPNYPVMNATARSCWRLQIARVSVFRSQYVFGLSTGAGVVSACADDCEDLGPLRSRESTCTGSTSPPNPSNNYYFSAIALDTSTCQIPPHHQEAAFVKLLSPAQIPRLSSYLTFIVAARSALSAKGHINILQLQ